MAQNRYNDRYTELWKRMGSMNIGIQWVNSSGAARSIYLYGQKGTCLFTLYHPDKVSPRQNTEVNVKAKTIKLVVRKKVRVALGHTNISETGHTKKVNWKKKNP